MIERSKKRKRRERWRDNNIEKITGSMWAYIAPKYEKYISSMS